MIYASERFIPQMMMIGKRGIARNSLHIKYFWGGRGAGDIYRYRVPFPTHHGLFSITTYMD